MIPRAYRQDFRIDDRVILFQSPIVDIYKSRRRGRQVCLKQYRVNPKVTTDSAKKVRPLCPLVSIML